MMIWPREWFRDRYRPVVQDDSDSDTLLSDSASKTEQEISTFDKIPQTRVSNVLVYWNVALFCLSLIMLIWSILMSYGYGLSGNDHRMAWNIINAPCKSIPTTFTPWSLTDRSSNHCKPRITSENSRDERFCGEY